MVHAEQGQKPGLGLAHGRAVEGDVLAVRGELVELELAVGAEE